MSEIGSAEFRKLFTRCIAIVGIIVFALITYYAVVWYVVFGRGFEFGDCTIPFGLTIENRDSENTLRLITVSLDSGETIDYGQLAPYQQAYRPIEIAEPTDLTVQVTLGNGRTYSLPVAIDVNDLRPVRIGLSYDSIEDYEEYPETCPIPCWIKEPCDGDARGVDYFWVVNDTADNITCWIRSPAQGSQRPESAKARTGKVQGKATKPVWHDLGSIEPYECFATSVPGDDPWLGSTQVIWLLEYANGAVYRVTVEADIKQYQRLVFIFQARGQVRVWDDPTVEDSATVETQEASLRNSGLP